MKLSPYDKVQAAIRIPQFVREYRALQNRSIGFTRKGISISPRYAEEREKFCKRWKIPYPDLADQIEVPGSLEYWEKEEELCKRRGIPFVKPKSIREWSKEAFPEPPPYEVIPYKKAKRMKNGRMDYTSCLENDRYLTLKIDLWANKGTILEWIEGPINFYRGLIHPPEGRYRGPTNDHWKVYDLREQGKKYEEIVQLLNPTSDKDVLLAHIKTAQKAYKRACQMIEEYKRACIQNK